MTEAVAGAEDAPAKVNLALHVRERLADGTHALETLFAFTRFGDRVEAAPAADWSLRLDGPTASDAGPDEDNLLLRAARAFAEASGCGMRWAFTLHKRIPVAAGLGGGSADAAATLRLLNRLSGANLSPEALEAVARPLGADVPACVRPISRWGKGRGELLSEGPDLAGMTILLVNPRRPCPTGPVFRAWDEVDRGPLGSDWLSGRNDLEAPAISLQPAILETLMWLRGLPGVRLARMSGSGATCFALFSGAVPPVEPPNGWWSVSTELL